MAANPVQTLRELALTQCVLVCVSPNARRVCLCRLRVVVSSAGPQPLSKCSAAAVERGSAEAGGVDSRVTKLSFPALLLQMLWH